MLSPNAITVLTKRYLRKDDYGQPVETPEGLFRRVAIALAEADRRYGATDVEVAATANQFFTLTYQLDFLPNSPTLANAGTPLGMLSACFVLPVDDDLGGIFNALKWQALIHQGGGGTGFSFSRLRPKNDRVGSTKGVSSGPVSFMRIFNAATESIKQGGMRRGANMGILRVDHPDILEFIDLKANLAEMTNFNVSVAVTDAFMAAVEAGATYPLVNPRTGAVTAELDARMVYRRIVERAWATGEPGVIFIDRMNRYCPVPWLGSYEACNPCAEQTLLPFESCNLGSINLENFVTADARRGSTIDWARLRLAVHVAMHLLDNVIDCNRFPLPELKAMSDATRKVGLGVMGFARLLFKLGVAYGTEESFILAEKLMSFIDYESKLASVELAKKRGSFPARNGHEAESNAIYRAWCEERDAREDKHQDADFGALADLIERHGIRNSTTTTVAPTGTLSILADTTGGCEPAFALAFKRNQADAQMVDADAAFRVALAASGLSAEAVARVMEQVEAHHGSLRQAIAKGPLDTVLAPHEREALAGLAPVYVTAHDIEPAAHVLIQAAFQRYNDSSCSKTCNFPAGSTVDQVLEVYRLAWETRCKGITIYRDGSRDAQPLTTSGTQHTGAKRLTITVSDQPPPGALTFSTYQAASARTANVEHGERDRRLISALGVAGEAGEVVELLKKFEGHGHPTDPARLASELGDLLWYVSDLATAYGLSLEAIARGNVEKLERRYPTGFSSDCSLARVDTDCHL